MGIQCWSDLTKYGAREYLQEQFGSYLSNETEAEYDVSLVLDLEALPESPGESMTLT
jgi:actin related protein 2/3 complex subunit 2